MKTTSAGFVFTSAVLAGLAHAIGMAPPPPVELVQGFDWKDPFALDAMASFRPTCEAKAQFEALEYTLKDLMEPPPKGLKPWSKGLKAVFADKEYPGGWLGLDPHLNGRSLLLMNYDQMPLLVRRWIEQQERTDGKGKALFAVLEKPKNDEDEIEKVVQFPEADKIDRDNDKDKVAIFAPGALYGILPLWTAGTSKCEDQFVDLSKYKPRPSDGGVVGWVMHTEPQNYKTKLDIKVQALKTKEVRSGQEQGQAKSASREEL
ncbi:hypothetical protein FOQG_06725 [Fusarium oxysporum f. sp. raphani 54005]|uniref:Uncharacterized protein n=6 Tax=Fusarium oxysporum TaxID=5507 RepID=W9IE71_FUSOX|nr:hypothetical protein FOC1_g10012985 [Fusarium oxysporum f. sp. cubense race 1]EWY91163.1 hypothetical protein FOYG_08377 [Fusarium oxysporum NRRL 32931]EXA45366.1 hypothetical protein FOVG_06434 [Fusarium oxysporum f. sp. pisi HDV247]EXK91316.1 hypothetical protein FOQG_06725 [Fusarium oxysporum f. sp. raphani 54005]EXM32303.1 hypothetical protein FOTG_02729 [Fusarium oxysporum f. sp. vasinfectum 25433]KAG7426898.1 hypothetical protein Forpi1262_v012090 [Fusarium oxysporum f. sp. raphani]K